MSSRTPPHQRPSEPAEMAKREWMFKIRLDLATGSETFRILAMDQFSYVSVARALIDRAAGDIVVAGDYEIEILSIE